MMPIEKYVTCKTCRGVWFFLITALLVNHYLAFNIYLWSKLNVPVCVCDGHISLTVNQTDLRFRMWLAHGTKLCILDFEDFSLRFSKDDYLRRPSSHGSVLFPRGLLLGGLRPLSFWDRLHLVDSLHRHLKINFDAGTALVFTKKDTHTEQVHQR